MEEQERQPQEQMDKIQDINIIFQQLKVETVYLDQLRRLVVDMVVVLISDIHLIMDMVVLAEVVVVHLDIVTEVQEGLVLDLLDKDLMAVQVVGSIILVVVVVQEGLVFQDQINQMEAPVYFIQR
jgi:hypothetical protein